MPVPYLFTPTDVYLYTDLQESVNIIKKSIVLSHDTRGGRIMVVVVVFRVEEGGKLSNSLQL